MLLVRFEHGRRFCFWRTRHATPTPKIRVMQLVTVRFIVNQNTEATD
jgi:hypothetical protein